MSGDLERRYRRVLRLLPYLLVVVPLMALQATGNAAWLIVPDAARAQAAKPAPPPYPRLG